MKNSKCDYNWNFSERILTSEDLNTGRMSVTNNIVNVLSEIKQKVGDKIHEAKIIYRDSEMIWPFSSMIIKFTHPTCQFSPGFAIEKPPTS